MNSVDLVSYLRLVEPLHGMVADYYTNKLVKYGPTPLGVDWSCVPTQEMRFIQLLKLCDVRSSFSLNDLGCGYGALVLFLSKCHRRPNIDYLGVDVAEAMVIQARQVCAKKVWASFEVGVSASRMADYSVASGVFNVKLHQSKEVWEGYVARVLSQLALTSRLGFSVNFLKPASPGGAGVDELYCVEPEIWMTFCRRQFAADVTVLSDYGMREFTLLVRMD